MIGRVCPSQLCVKMSLPCANRDPRWNACCARVSSSQRGHFYHGIGVKCLVSSTSSGYRHVVVQARSYFRALWNARCNPASLGTVRGNRGCGHGRICRPLWPVPAKRKQILFRRRALSVRLVK